MLNICNTLYKKYLFIFFSAFCIVGCSGKYGIFSDLIEVSHNTLNDTPLHNTIFHPQLSNRLTFFSLFPWYLLQQANVIESSQSMTEQSFRYKNFASESKEISIEEMFQEQDEFKRAMALEIASKNGNAEIPKEFWQNLPDESSYIKIITLHNFSNNPQKLLAYTLELLQDEEEVVRFVALKRLSDFPNYQIVSHLYKCLNDPSGLIRGETVHILSEMGMKESIEYLWPLLEDREFYVRKKTLEALIRLTEEKAISLEECTWQQRKEKILNWRSSWEKRRKQIKNLSQ